ncbi:MAG: hypothetical protein AAF960_29455, partial [Bacteroidota bacterium]
MERKLTFLNFWTHPRFWRHFWAWAIFIFFLIILIIASAIANPSSTFVLESSKVFVFLFGILLLVYAAFFAYNVLYPQKRYGALGLSFLIIILVMAYFNERFGVQGIVIGNLKGYWANVVMYPFILMVAFGFKLAYHGARQLFVIERLKNQQVESELKLLKSQVNPHFLF